MHSLKEKSFPSIIKVVKPLVKNTYVHVYLTTKQMFFLIRFRSPKGPTVFIFVHNYLP